ncbi:germinal-center associated nuclear protein [Asbolus verrucosus]|uniref:Germinal-center associated nuclear protein n=1 Tax=Asbolus verrucosus TaxID=1661398 RepID=A0A482WDE3_ASBVE|nr:germinal-center associated nuclear protein [Asbolus verrucosus]
MEEISNYLQGTCMEMCPQEELEMREKEKLLHILEMIPGTENSKFPKANRNFVVKSFSRSAAGKAINRVEHLRPPEVLLKTVSYLLFDVINSDLLPWYAVYDFITDRLMAVRQDMVVQNISNAESITILQPIVRFHAYAAYKLCDENVSNFDPVLNNSHLQESLKRLLYFYDAYNDFLVNEHAESSTCFDYLMENRPEFEALYIIFNLGNEEALRRALIIPQKCKSGLKYHTKRPKLSKMLSSFLFVITMNMQINKKIACSAGCSSIIVFTRNQEEILMYGSISEVAQDSNYYGISSDDQHIYFSRQTFNTSKAPVSSHAYNAAAIILTMLYNLLPLFEGFTYLLRFMLDKLIDIFETSETYDKIIKTLIFMGQLVVLFFLLYFIITTLMIPILNLTVFFVNKIFSLSS